MPTQSTSPSSRIPSLDGLRAVSIALVVISHAVGHPVDGSFAGLYFSYLGELGVSVFFVISGYLITRLLLQEHNKVGGISLPNFYIRRTLRIWPPFFLFLGVLLALRAVGMIGFPTGEWLGAAAFIWNYLPGAGSWWLSHSWSLAVEEQFYLLWPLVLVFAGRRKALLIVAGFVAVAPMLRFLTYQEVPMWRDRLFWLFHTRADTLLLGCGCALLEDGYFGRALARVRSVFESPVTAALSLVFLAGISPWLRHMQASRYLFTVGYALEAAAATSILVWTVNNPATFPGRVINSTPLVHLGLWSYSLYLWQQLFLKPEGGLLGSNIPFNIVAALTAAIVSYYTVEKFFQPVRARFTTQRPSSQDRFKEAA